MTIDRKTKVISENETYTLLVYEEIPDDLITALIPNSWLTDKDRELFEFAAGKYVNGDDLSAEDIDRLNLLSAGFHAENADDSTPNKWVGGLEKFVVFRRSENRSFNDREFGKHNSGMMVGKTITAVYVTGFVL